MSDGNSTESTETKSADKAEQVENRPEPVEQGPDHDDDAPEKPPRGVHTMAIVRWAILIFVALAAIGTWFNYARADRGASESAMKYQCPMHPQIVSDQPGECPICHMTLEPISADRLKKPGAAPAHDHGSAPAPAPATSAADGAAAASSYTCPMHPEVVSDKPGRCPICGMDLVPKAAPQAPVGSASVTSGAPGSTPPGVTPIHLSLDRLQAIGVRTALVEEQSSSSSLRATATVQAPEQNVAEVHVRAAGFVEGISVKETGVKVKAGQGLISIYSPEIYQAQSELLATKDWGLLPDAGAGQRGEAARQKLALLGVSGGVADKVISSGKPFRTTGVSAPISGFVTKKNVVLGAYVTPEMALYEIVDLSKVYVVADVFQQNIGAVAIGTTGKFSSATRRDVSVEAKVDLIYPQVNPEARTTRVRMQVKNANLSLLPGEYGYVEFLGQSQTSVLVPRDAIIDTGRQIYVFVEDSPGQFSPRTIETGPELGEKVEVRAGLKKGERVVSGATFLIDSESRLQASLAGSEPGAAPVASGCDAQFDQQKYPDKNNECRKCEQVHKGMGSMVDDCKNAIPKPWK